jgi:hypothetical protein
MIPVDSVGIDAPVNPTAQLLATLGTVAVALVSVALTIVLCRRERIWWPLIVLAGGTLTCVLEPLYDHLYGLWFLTEGQWNAFTAYGIHVPVWLPIIYLAYYGPGSLLVWYRLHRGATMRDAVTHFGISVLGAGAAEMFYINAVGLYNYQDHQPFFVLNYPVFVAIVNGVPPMLSGIILYRLVPVLRGPARVLLLFVIPFAFAGNAFGNGWLYLAYRHSGDDPSMVVLTLLALLTTALSIAVIWVGALMAGVGQTSATPSVGRRATAAGL